MPFVPDPFTLKCLITLKRLKTLKDRPLYAFLLGKPAGPHARAAISGLHNHRQTAVGSIVASIRRYPYTIRSIPPSLH